MQPGMGGNLAEMAKFLRTSRLGGNIEHVPDRNVLGGPLEPCGTDPLTGYYRDGCCSSGPEDLGRHTICAVMTAEFLEHQRSIGNDLLTPVPEYRFPGLLPGDRYGAGNEEPEKRGQEDVT